jgi:hypothetical protein
LVIGFTAHLYTQLVTTSIYNSLTCLHTLKDHCKCSTHKVFYVFTSRFLVTDLNSVLCLRLYRLANIPQLTRCSNYLPGWRPSHTNLLLFSSLTPTQDPSLPCIGLSVTGKGTLFLCRRKGSSMKLDTQMYIKFSTDQDDTFCYETRKLITTNTEDWHWILSYTSSLLCNIFL